MSGHFIFYMSDVWKRREKSKKLPKKWKFESELRERPDGKIEFVAATFSVYFGSILEERPCGA